MKYKIGQILTSKVDTEIEKTISGEKAKIPKGNKIIVGADKMAHHLSNGFVQMLQNNDEVEGYDCKGIAEYLYTYMKNHFEIDEMLESYYDTKERFIEEIECALEEIGF